MSQVITYCGSESVSIEYIISIPNVPLFEPRSIPKLSVPELATTISDRLSLLKSPIATENGCEAEPVEYIVWLANSAA